MSNSLGNYLLNNILNEVNDDYVNLISNNGTNVKIHKCIARKSNFINLLINENSEESVIEITLDYDFTIIDILRNYLYEIKINLDKSNFKDLFYLADYLSVTDLCEYLLNWIFRSYLNNSNAISCYKFIKASSYKESEYYERIKIFIDKNLNDILFKNEIKLLPQNEYYSLLGPELNPKLILTSFKLWSEDMAVEEKRLNLKKLLDNEIFIPGLIDVQDLFSDYFVYLDFLNIELSDNEKLGIIELSNFRKSNFIYNKKDFDKYKWCMNLKEGQEIDFKDNCSFKWLTGVIKNCRKINRSSIYNSSKIIEIKCCNKEIEFILPDDINHVDYLHNNTIEWRKQLEKNMIVNFCDNDVFLPAKILEKQGDEILILTSEKFLIKISIYSKDVFTSNMIFLDYFEDIKFKTEKFKDIKLNTKISYLVYIDNE